MRVPGEVVAGGVVGVVVAGTAAATYQALQEAAPYHEAGNQLLVDSCTDPAVQAGVAHAVGERLADSASIDPTSIPGVTVGADGAASVASSPDACVGALNHFGTYGISSSARRAALEVIAQTNPDLAAKINELSGYISPWAIPAAAGSLMLLGGVAWVYKRIFIS